MVRYVCKVRSMPLSCYILNEVVCYAFPYVIGSVKRSLIADPNSTYLETHNLTYEFNTTLKLGPNIVLLIGAI